MPSSNASTRNRFAAASIAQVHTAQLPDGTEVIVKLLRPGVQEQIHQDIAVLRMIAGLADRYWEHGQRLKPLEVVSEYEQTIIDELDLMREAANTAQLKRNFADSDLLYVPDIYWDYCRPEVMVQERIYGIPISDMNALRESGANIKVLAENGVEIFFTQVFRHNFFHADMHPGNIFVIVEDPEKSEVRGGRFRHRRYAESRRPEIPCPQLPRVLRPRLSPDRETAHRLGLGAGGYAGRSAGDRGPAQSANRSSTSRLPRSPSLRC